MQLDEYQFITDENIDYSIVSFLREKGASVFDIKEQELFGLADIEILKLGLSEKRIIITQDADFGTLVFRENVTFYGLIYLRPGHFSGEFHIQTLKGLEDAKLTLSTPFIIVAENKGDKIVVRLRLF